MASYESYYEQIKKQTAADRQAAKDKSNQLYENQKTVAQEQFNSQIKDTTSAYDENYRMARIQKAINERQIAENMANMGLTDSGLNRTQITANQLSYGNTVGKLDVAKQKAVDALALALRESVTGIENNRLQAEAGIDQQYDKYASDAATEMYKADVEAETARQKAAASSGGGRKTTVSFNDIKNAINGRLITKSKYNKLGDVKIAGRSPTYKSVEGELFESYADYRDKKVLDLLGGYVDAGIIDPSQMNYYYTLLK